VVDHNDIAHDFFFPACIGAAIRRAILYLCQIKARRIDTRRALSCESALAYQSHDRLRTFSLRCLMLQPLRPSMLQAPAPWAA
jgi:hypothetical protein